MTLPALQVLFVVDGLRPDLIDDDVTPTIARLRRDGVDGVNAHVVCPPVTRVNAASMATGGRPGATGLVGNELYWPAVDAAQPVRTADGASLQRLHEASGELLHRPSLGRHLHEAGRRLVSVGSGSSGSALLLNSEADEGHGIMISTNRAQNGMPTASPPSVEAELLARFGAPPVKVPSADFTATIAYATRVVCDYVLPDLQPDVLIYWITEPDHAHHTFGLTAGATIAARRAADQAVAVVLKAIDATGRDDTNVLVVSDHGFSTVTGTVDLEVELIRAGLKDGPASTDVVVALSGCGLLYVDEREPERIERIVRFLQGQTWSEALFTPPHRPPTTRPASPAPTDGHHGWVEGTFSDRLLGYAGNLREPDIVVSLPWSDGDGGSGLSGESMAFIRGGTTSPVGQHGNLSRHDIRSTMIGWGPAFRSAAVVEAPTGNLDVAATLLALSGFDTSTVDGRVLTEFLSTTRDPVPAHHVQTLRAEDQPVGYAAPIDMASLDGHRYLSQARRDR